VHALISAIATIAVFVLLSLSFRGATLDGWVSGASVGAAAGQAPIWFRPPQGVGSDRLLQTASDLGLQTTLWTNVGVSDHPDRTPAELAEGLAAAAYPGSVLMIHQDRAGTVSALGPMLDQIAGRGLVSVTLSNFDRP